MALWIVEAGAFRTGADGFERAVRQAGGELRWLSVDDEFHGRYGGWEEGESVFFRGSFEAAESFRAKRPDARPGVIGEAEALRCSSYYPALGVRLLNAEHEFVPLRDLRPRWTELQTLIPIQDSEGQARPALAAFVRPDSGAKAFTGQVVSDLDAFEARERSYLSAMDEGDLVVVALPKRIESEWRTMVVGRDVVAGSRYKSRGKRDVSPDVPADVLAFAQGTASEIAPPVPAYMLDVAREEGGRLSVVELNSFSCSALYACDPAPVVKSVQALFA